MSDNEKRILLGISFIIGVILTFHIIRYLFRIFTKYDPKIEPTISNKESIYNFYDHIFNLTENSNNTLSSYFKKFNVKNKYLDYENVFLYNNPLDTRLFSIDDKGEFYRNLSTTFTK